ncbi:MAG: hypothetical protein CMJ43_18575 [Phyllobacteriaceae bacterium]|nr:hypothetical protein [Phyllobacteriaceae bacterium]
MRCLEIAIRFCSEKVDPLFMRVVTFSLLKVITSQSRTGLVALGLMIGLGACAAAPTISDEVSLSQAGPQIRTHLAKKKDEKKKSQDNKKNHFQENPELIEAEKKRLSAAEYHFGMAQAYSTGGQVNQAIEEYKLVLMYDPESALVHLRLAAEYIKKGSLSDALTSAKEAVRLDSNLMDARLLLAGLYSSTQENEEALKQYQAILKNDPTHDEAAVYRAQIHLEAGKPLKAVQSLKNFIAANPKNKESAAAWYYLARVQQQTGKLKTAEASFKKALDLQKSFYQAALALGRMYEAQEKTSEALKLYESFYENYQHQEIASRMATIYLKKEKYKEAIPYLEMIRAADPNDLNVRVKLGLVRMEMKEYPKAIEIFEEILEKNPGSERVLYYLGSLYEEMGDYENAIAHLKKIDHESQFFEDSALHVTFLLKKLQRRKEAKAMISEAIEKAPNYAAFYIFNASLKEEEEDIDGAVETLEKAKKRFPDHEKIRYYLGSLYDRQGETKKSIQEMEAILETNPKHADALNYIAYTWTVQGTHLEKAEEYIRRAMKIRPKNGYIVDSLGWNLFVRGKVKEAIPYLEKAANLKPNEATILDHLADAYLKANLQNKALVQYRKAFEVAQDEKLKDKIQKKIRTVETRIANQVKEDQRSVAGD